MESQQDNRPVMVTIICTVFNHKLYLRQCLDGFVMQRANFRFEAIVHDDVSTDKSVEIIKEYADKYPDIIIPVYETENQYSKNDGSLQRILDERTRGKYVALCEGDDYWTDSQKLQKQYDFMKTHPECSMCFHANKKLMPSGELVSYGPPHRKEIYTTEDIIFWGGAFMATNSMFYSFGVYQSEPRPAFWSECPIGDLPMALFFAAKGYVGYIDEEMSVYRIGAIGSWTSRQNTLKKRRSHYKAIIKMYNQYDEYTGFKYHKAIRIKQNRNTRNYIKSNIILIVRNTLKKIGITV